MKHRGLRALFLVVATAAFAACDSPATDLLPAVRAPGELAPLLSAGARAIPDRYVVVLENGVATSAAASSEMVAAHGGRLHFSYQNALNGFAATLSPEALEQLRRNPRVRYVAQDGWTTPDQAEQPNATWGLDRIDQRALPLNTTFTYTASGNGVNVYVIDTGIRATHSEFGGRASVGADLVGDGRNGDDCNGHGTHVAGTIAGSTYGVARNAKIIAVRVFPCSGGASMSTIIAAVEWVTANAQKPAVANMSLGGGVYAPLNDAVTASIASGVVYAVAAGNEGADACTRSPASTPGAITVASSTSTDARSSFSNWGSCVDLFAPGSSITSAWYTSDSAVNTISGTSMATPHVAGAAAAYLENHPTATPAEVADVLIGTGTTGAISNAGGSPNKLLYSPLTPEAPGPRIVLSRSALLLTFLRITGGPAVAPAGSPPIQRFTSSGDGSPRPASEVEPGGIYAAATIGSTMTVPLTLSNGGTRELNWTASADRPWLAADPASGMLTPGAISTFDATVSSATLPPGTHTGTLAVRDSAAGVPTGQVSVTVRVAAVPAVQPGTPRTNLSADAGSAMFYAVTVPSGATSLSIATSGGVGDADLYVRYADAPTHSTYQCRPFLNGNSERCDLSRPAPGTYFVMLYGWAAYSGVTLSATLGGPPPAPASLTGTITGPSSIRLAWVDRGSNEDSFTLARRVWTSATTVSDWEDVATPAANATTFFNGGLAGGGPYPYQYRVRACNAAGCSPWTTSSWITLAVPAAPTDARATAGAGNRVQVTWTDASSNEGSFTLTRRPVNPDGTLAAVQAVGASPAGGTVYTDSAVTAGQAYRYQVRACNPVGCSAPGITGNVATAGP